MGAAPQRARAAWAAEAVLEELLQRASAAAAVQRVPVLAASPVAAAARVAAKVLGLQRAWLAPA